MDIAQLQDKANTASELLKVLGNENRLLIVCQLVDGEKSVNELEQRVGIRQSALSQHLAILRREGIVKTRRESQFIYYSLDSSEAKSILKTLYGIYCSPKGRA
ncbi:MAG: winged helix-turn-helix transcriptional regulator [Alphaproteobacteria bacterium]|nr:winged helix-turn-helix transcriptional regulator [Alphaproteobacteria bacterium]